MQEIVTHYKDLSLEDIEGEVWKNIAEYEGYYQVSNMGRVKGLQREVPHPKKGTKTLQSKIMKQYVNKMGYCTVCLRKRPLTKTAQVHQLVGKVWIPNPENKPTINHIKAIKTDNRVSELEWATVKEQTQHAAQIGLILRGIRHPRFGKICERGKENVFARSVIQYDLAGNFIKVWGCIMDVERALGINGSDISAACLLIKIKQAGNFQWRYFNDDFEKSIGIYNRYNYVFQLSKEGNHIKTWDSVIEAKNTLNIAHQSIYHCCNKKRKSAGGFLWEYAT